MKRIYHTDSCKTLQSGAVLTGGSFCVRDLAEMGKMSVTGMAVRENGDANTAIGRPENYRAKLANASFGRGKVGRLSGFSGKNHPHCVPVFFPKTLPYRKRPP